jgi:hypothetical protein
MNRPCRRKEFRCIAHAERKLVTYSRAAAELDLPVLPKLLSFDV